MIRLTGILIGAAVAVAVLVLVLGLPRLPGEAAAGTDGEALADDAAVAAVQTPVTETPVVAVSVPELPAAEPEPEPLPSEALIEQVFAPEESREIVAPPDPEPVVDENWYAFWSPFRSELAANGFVAKLQESTGLDYRVVKVKTGVYEVAFAYSDDADIQSKLDRIAAATGLDMSGG